MQRWRRVCLVRMFWFHFFTKEENHGNIDNRSLCGKIKRNLHDEDQLEEWVSFPVIMMIDLAGFSQGHRQLGLRQRSCQKGSGKGWVTVQRRMIGTVHAIANLRYLSYDFPEMIPSTWQLPAFRCILALFLNHSLYRLIVLYPFEEFVFQFVNQFSIENMADFWKSNRLIWLIFLEDSS